MTRCNCDEMSDEIARLRKSLQRIALLADTGSDQHKQEYAAHYAMKGHVPHGWIIAEDMRQIANDAVGNLPVEDDSIYKRAMESMAAQMIHPRMSAREMAELQLKGTPCGKS